MKLTRRSFLKAASALPLVPGVILGQRRSEGAPGLHDSGCPMCGSENLREIVYGLCSPLSLEPHQVSGGCCPEDESAFCADCLVMWGEDRAPWSAAWDTREMMPEDLYEEGWTRLALRRALVPWERQVPPAWDYPLHGAG